MLRKLNSFNLTKRILCFMLAAILLCSIPLSAFAAEDNTQSVAAAAKIEYIGAVTYGAYGTTVGDFRVDGQQAFCIENHKGTPATGTANSGASVYDNNKIKIALYYGWGGPENIFTNKNEGVVSTSCVLSYLYCGQSYGQSLPGFAKLMSKVNSNAVVPDNKVAVAKENLSVSVKNGRQISESVKVVASTSNAFKIDVPAKITLVNETKGASKTNGTITVYGGDTIHLEAPLDYKGSFNSGAIKGSIKAFQPLVVKTTSDSLQNLGSWRWYTDPEQQFTLKANFTEQTGGLKIIKTSEDKIVKDVSFKITGGGIEKTVKTGDDGTVTASDLSAGTYTVLEVMVGDKYVPQDEQKIKVEAGKTTEVKFNNKLAYVQFKVEKVDELAPGYKLANVEFGVFADKNCTQYATNLDGSSSASDNTFVTNEEGIALSVKYLPGKDYYFKETKGQKDYIINDTVWKVSTKMASSGKIISIGDEITVGYDSKGQEIKSTVVTNRPTKVPGLISVKKFSGLNMLSGADFTAIAETEFKDAAGNTIYKKGQKITDMKMGNVLAAEFFIPNVGEGGKIKVTEIKAPLGFWKSDDYVIFEFDPKNPSRVVSTDELTYILGTVSEISDPDYQYLIGQGAGAFNNMPLKGKIIIEKKDKDTLENINIYDGALFDVYADEDFYTGDVPAKKLYSAGDKITSTKMFGGSVTISNMYAGTGGRIRIVETKAPPSYQLPEKIEDRTYYMVLDSSIYDKNGVVTAYVSGNENLSVLTVYNEKIKGDLLINKTSEDKVVEGLKFTATGNGKTYSGITDGNGNVLFEGLPVYNDAGNKITYTLKENDVPVRYIEATNQSTELTENKVTTIKFENKLKRGNIKLNKESEDGVIAGIEFSVMATNSNGEIYSGTTADDGTLLFEKLPIYNTNNEIILYAINEENVPVRYVYPAEQVISLEYNKTKEITFKNTLKRVDLNLVKRAEGESLEGFNFAIEGADGFRQEKTTDANGKITFEGLIIYDKENAPITYTIYENDVPVYYVTPETQAITLGEEIIDEETGEKTENIIEFVNNLKRGNLEVVKSAEDGFEEGREFLLEGTSMSGESVSLTAVIGADKRARFENVLIGSYTLSEINVPNRYVLPAPMNVTIEWNSTAIAEVYNELKRIDIGTTAKDVLTEDHCAFVSEETTIIDVVHAQGLAIGEEYTINGTLMVKATGEPLLIDGIPVISETTFIATESEMNIELPFIFNSSVLQGEEVVAFEKISINGIEVGSHTDIEDEGQTVEFKNPEIGTTALDSETQEHYAYTSELTTIYDTVQYSGLIVGKEYEIFGVLMDKETGEPLLVDGEQVTGYTKFTASGSEGTEVVSFTLDSRALQGKALVVFEDIYFGERLIAFHHDLEDEGQTIIFKDPSVKTTAKDSVSDNNTATPSKETTIIDTVELTGLIVGKEYTLKGILKDKEAGEDLIIDGKTVTSELTFTATSENMTVELPFTFDSSSLAGKSIVVFEYLYFNNREIAVHTDLTDEGQTITFETPKIPETPQITTKTPTPDNGTGTPTPQNTTASPQTGYDSTNLVIAFFMSIAFLMLAIFLITNRKRIINETE